MTDTIWGEGGGEDDLGGSSGRTLTGRGALWGGGDRRGLKSIFEALGAQETISDKFWFLGMRSALVWTGRPGLVSIEGRS